MGSFCIYKQQKRISILFYGEFMESAILHNIRCLSFSVVYKCRRIPLWSYVTLTSLSSKVDREYSSWNIVLNKQHSFHEHNFIRNGKKSLRAMNSISRNKGIVGVVIVSWDMWGNIEKPYWDPFTNHNFITSVNLILWPFTSPLFKHKPKPTSSTFIPNTFKQT